MWDFFFFVENVFGHLTQPCPLPTPHLHPVSAGCCLAMDFNTVSGSVWRNMGTTFFFFCCCSFKKGISFMIFWFPDVFFFFNYLDICGAVFLSCWPALVYLSCFLAYAFSFSHICELSFLGKPHVTFLACHTPSHVPLCGNPASHAPGNALLRTPVVFLQEAGDHFVLFFKSHAPYHTM